MPSAANKVLQTTMLQNCCAVMALRGDIGTNVLHVTVREITL
jgi:hypothetical protein